MGRVQTELAPNIHVLVISGSLEAEGAWKPMEHGGSLPRGTETRTSGTVRWFVLVVWVCWESNPGFLTDQGKCSAAERHFQCRARKIWEKAGSKKRKLIKWEKAAASGAFI